MNTLSSRGQITIFVIIGAILLLGAVLVFIIQQNVNEEKPRLDVPDVSLEARPAYEIVQTCLDSVSEEGLRQIGLQGGTLQAPTVRYPPYRSEAIEYEPNVIPYWRYLDTCEQGPCEKVFIPPLCKSSNAQCGDAPRGDNSIQEQLERYTQEHLSACINNFETIGESYDITINDEPEVEVSFTPQEVYFTLDYPITLRSLSTDNTEDVNDYYVSQSVPLRQIHALALEILNHERQENFYEAQTLNFIALYSGTDGVLPPMDGFTFFEGGERIWIQQEVKEIMQYDLLPFMSLLRFVNTANYFPLADNYDNFEEYEKYAAGLYASMAPQTSQTMYDLDVYHDYLYQDIFLQIDDGDQVIRGKDLNPQEHSPFFSMMGLFLKDYRFNYHLSYPLVISIEDEDALQGEGYDFQFGIEVNIRNNIDGYHPFTTLESTAPFSVNSADIDQRLNRTFTIETINKRTGKPLEDVLISYVCGREYELGLTKLDAQGQAVFTTTLPYCEYGGALRYKKAGYLGESQAFNNREELPAETSTQFTFELWPTISKEIIIKKRTAQDLQALQSAGEDAFVLSQQYVSNLSENQQVLFNIQRQKTSAYDTDIPLRGFLRYQEQPTTIDRELEYQQQKLRIQRGYDDRLYNESVRDTMLASAQFNYNNPIETGATIPEHYTVDLVPGTYEVDMTLLDKNGVTIPAETLDINEDANALEKLFTSMVVDEENQEVDLPQQNFTTWVLGGGVTNVTISENLLYAPEPIIFYVLEQPRPHVWADLMDYQSIEEYQKGKEFYLTPTFGE